MTDTYLFFKIKFFSAEIQGKYNTLQWRSIHLGGLYHLQEASHSTTVPNFVGDIQQFYFNNIPYIELARALKTDTAISGFPTIKVAAKFIKNATDNLHRPVTFRSKHTFIGKYRKTSFFYSYNSQKRLPPPILNRKAPYNDCIMKEPVRLILM